MPSGPARIVLSIVVFKNRAKDPDVQRSDGVQCAGILPVGNQGPCCMRVTWDAVCRNSSEMRQSGMVWSKMGAGGMWETWCGTE